MTISWDQVRAWRLQRQFLEPRGSADAVDVISRLCGVQAQVKSSADLAVRLRQVTPKAGQVEDGIADRTLVKTWAMRGTLHLLRGSEAGFFLSLIASARTWYAPAWQRAFGATPTEIEALVDIVSEALEAAVLTRDELVTKIVATQGFAKLEEHLRSGWGAILKPLAWQGVLCHGPSQGNKITFTRPDTLIPEWKAIPEPDEAAPHAIAAYLGAYGPATPEIFNAWLLRGALKKPVVRRWFADLGDKLTKVDVEGEDAYILSEHADELARITPSESVRLLGAFDQYVLGPGTKDPQILAPAHRAKVSKAAGWIAPIVVVDGRITGVWELTDNEVSASFFPGAPKPSAKALETEVAHVARASGTNSLTLRVL